MGEDYRSCVTVIDGWGVVQSPQPAETDKQRALDAIEALSETATIEDAIERLCLISKIEEGLRQSESDARQVVSHEEIRNRYLS